MRIYFLVRSAIISVLLFFFLYRTYSSVSKYLARETMTVTKRIPVDYLEYPGITICAFGNPRKGQENSGNLSEMWESYERPNFIREYEHGFHAKKLDLNTSKEWRVTPSVDPWRRRFVLCYTYTATEDYPLGYRSRLTLRMATKSLHQICVMVHSKGQNFVITSGTYGRRFAFIPMLLQGQAFKFISYRITPTEKENMPNNQLPCHQHKDYNLGDCFDKHYEAAENCTLPWRFRQMSEFYRDSSEQEMYERTGCYFGCTHYSYRIARVNEHISNETDAGSVVDMDLKLILGGGALKVEKEVLSFDLDDLVGNIGGFLGLFLGASILSLVDEFKNAGERIMERLRGMNTNKISPM